MEPGTCPVFLGVCAFGDESVALLTFLSTFVFSSLSSPSCCSGTISASKSICSSCLENFWGLSLPLPAYWARELVC